MPWAPLARRRYGKSAIAEASIAPSTSASGHAARTQNRIPFFLIAHKTRLPGEASNDHENDSQCREAECNGRKWQQHVDGRVRAAKLACPRPRNRRFSNRGTRSFPGAFDGPFRTFAKPETATREARLRPEAAR